MLFSPQILSRGRRGASGLVAGAEATAFLARTTGLDATHTNAYTALINGLVTDSVFSKLDVLHVYATQNSTTALLNLVSSSYNGTRTGATFVADRGMTGVNASAADYINTNFNPSTAGGQFVQNSAHFSAWVTTDGGTNIGSVLGANNSGSTIQNNLYPKYSDNNCYVRINSGGIGGVANADSSGHYIGNRSSSVQVNTYRNGSSILSNGAAASTALVNLNMYALATNENGTADGNGAHQLAMISIGSSLSGTDATNFYNRLRTFMTVVGVP